MAQKRWSTEEKLEIVLTALKSDVDVSVAELCKKHGISDTTFYKWHSKFLEVARRLSPEARSGQRSVEISGFVHLVLLISLSKSMCPVTA